MSGSKSQTTTANSEPWAAAQPALKTAIGNATSLFKSGVGSQPFTGSTVVPFAKQTTQAMNQMQAGANQAMPALQRNFAQVADFANNGSLNNLQKESVDALRPMAQGKMLEGNPYLDKIIQKNADDIST